MARRSRNSGSRLAKWTRSASALAAWLYVLGLTAICRAADDNPPLQFFYLHDNPPLVARAQDTKSCPQCGGKSSDKNGGDADENGKGKDDNDDDKGDKDKDDDEKKIHYGPDACKPRKTLMQWSYGTTFSGGPPSMDEPLESDRPDFSESSKTVGKGVVQLETGYDFILDHHAGDLQTDHSFPDTLWRIGLFADWFEFRIEYNYEVIDDTITHPPIPTIHKHLSGSDDLRLGFKIGLTPQEGFLPSTAIVPQMTVPSGAPGISEGQVEPSVVLAYEWEITKKLDLSMISELDRARDDEANDFTLFEEAMSLQYAWTKQLATYTEFTLFSPTGHTDVQVQWLLDGGFIYHVTNNLQFDIECGVGLNEPAIDFFAGTGAVLRL